MGYRSEVAYIVQFKNEEQRTNFLTLQIAKQNEHTNNALKELTKLEGNKLFFHAGDVKWYDSYPDVQSHTDLYTEAVELFGDDGAGYLFYRIGEEFDDVVNESDGEYDDLWDYMSINRSINVDFPVSIAVPVINEEGVLA